MRLPRASGILLHPTSLPGAGGIGSLGPEAYAFVDWLADAGQSYWQILPLVAVDEGGSPYNALSAMAGNPLLIDLHALVEEGLLDEAEAASAYGARDERHVDFDRVTARHDGVLARAYEDFAAGAAPHLRGEFDAYRRRNADWLDDYALFRALRERHHRASWTSWDRDLRDRSPEVLDRARAELAEPIAARSFEQFLFDRQWAALREHARSRGVRVIGDIPIFVAHDSADVWANRELFELDPGGEPRIVSGVPPDYFSETGQRWGNPLYRWSRLRERGYDWWVRRFRRTLEWVDLVRVDHFRGFEGFWEIEADQPTAVNGRWRPGPGRDLFDVIRAELGEIPVIAEDLGLITPEVERLRDDLGLPGMRVLQFAFDGDPSNPHLPENYPENVVAYTGTHDNDTTAGWWASAPDDVKRRVEQRIGGGEEPPVWALIEMVLRSPAALAVVPVQDLLGLGDEARMNVPGTSDDNWTWRLDPDRLTPALARRLLETTRAAGRGPRGADNTADEAWT